jgi:hypothetical protein
MREQLLQHSDPAWPRAAGCQLVLSPPGRQANRRLSQFIIEKGALTDNECEGSCETRHESDALVNAPLQIIDLVRHDAPLDAHILRSLRTMLAKNFWLTQ